jgi:hypothetical protein
MTTRDHLRPPARAFAWTGRDYDGPAASVGEGAEGVVAHYPE